MFIIACPAGTYGGNCSLICPKGYYGTLCRKKCECENDEICHSITGCSPYGKNYS
ncbi:hypothetical protein FSP39_003153 [Pinctada imbricata]|uniref:Uncharacterized protein n=1 Tax=Pinctada imbricata TaxID=66713 RepID=A0AA89C164_PINIB|nr:hypothetical protein FSP39_003153 [Pinctada imbricata]